MSDFQPDAYPNCDPYANLNPTSFYTADSNTDFDIHLALTGRQDGTNYRDGSGYQDGSSYQDSTGYRDDYRDRTGYGDGTGYQDGTGPGLLFTTPFQQQNCCLCIQGRCSRDRCNLCSRGLCSLWSWANASGPMQLMRPGQSVQPTTVQQSGSTTQAE